MAENEDQPEENNQTIRLGYGPDAVDAFKYYALREDKIPSSVSFEFFIENIHTLNRLARDEELEFTGLSVHAYAYLNNKYNLLTCGASIGDGYGPVVVGRYNMTPEQLTKADIAIPGPRTTAHLILQLYAGEQLEADVIPPDTIVPRILEGEYDAGLIIHEDLMLYSQTEVTEIVDLGTWWQGETGLPLPVGTMAVHRDVDNSEEIGGSLKDSIQYGMDHSEEALDYAEERNSRLSSQQVEDFIQLYVNDFALDVGSRGRESVRTVLTRSHEAGLLPEPVSPVFVQVD